jgi:hypothetical protein
MGGAKRYPSIACRGGDGFRGAQRIQRIDNKTGSSDLPVGLFVDRRVESYFWFSEKYFGSHLPQITSRTLASHPTRGAYHDRHGRGVECGGRGSVGARGKRRAGLKACERSLSEQTNNTDADGKIVWS